MLALLAAVVVLFSPRMSAAEIVSGATPLAQVLNDDGTIDLGTGYHGTVNLSGFRMETASDGTPRFVREVATPATTATTRSHSGNADDHWNTGFSQPGINEVRTAAVMGSDLYIGGNFTTAAGITVNAIAKWNGEAWAALGVGLTTSTGAVGLVQALAVLGDDLYVGGSFTNAGNLAVNNIAKWDGTVWSSVGSGTNGTVTTLAAAKDILYVGGGFTSVGGVSASRIATWNGNTWSALGSGVNNGVEAIQPVGSDLYIGGSFTTAGSVSAQRIAKWNGLSWTALGDGLTASGFGASVKAIAVVGDDVYAGGDFTHAGGVPAGDIAKWDGQSWFPLLDGVSRTGGGANVRSFLVDGTDLYVAGTFDVAGETPASNVAKWDGISWSAVGSGLDQPVYSLAMLADHIFAVGGFSTGSNSTGGAGVAEWDGSSWYGLGAGAGNPVYALALAGTDLYAGGVFRRIGGIAANCIAKWDGAKWSPLGAGVLGGDFTYGCGVNAIEVVDNDVYVGGAFTTAGDVFANRIAKWDGSSWSALGSGVDGTVHALHAIGSDLYVGGEFSSAGGVSASRIARWNGSWSALGTGLSFPCSGCSDVALASIESVLYVGGAFTNAGGSGAKYVAAWNGSTWSPLGTGLDARAYALTSLGSDLYVGGSFATAGGQPAASIARWNGTQWFPLGAGVGGGRVEALAVLGTDLYAGGYFTSAGGTAANRIARWDGSTWSALGSGVNSSVEALQPASSDIYVGGSFTTAGGKQSYRIAQYHAACGNGVVDTGEECDPGTEGTGSCCNANTCRLERLGHACRAASGVCDAVEACNGSTSVCPSDALATTAKTCRNTSNVCDIAEKCTGTSATCPSNTLAGADTVCRTSTSICDVEEKCTGITSACPQDGFASSSTVCRTAAAACDAEEFCRGTSSTCPADALASASVECRAAAGACDIAEKCSGTSTACPEDKVRSPDQVCRSVAGVCDVAEACSGTSATCPNDAFLSSTSTCRAVAGICDAIERCTGSDATCPADAFADSSKLCRSAANQCDADEFCTGANAVCPFNSFDGAGSPCGSFGESACDHADSCNGAGTCLQNIEPNGTTCDDANICTVDQCMAGGCDSTKVPGCPVLPEDLAIGDEFGSATALTPEFLVVGAPGSKSTSSGRVHVFRAIDGVYVPQAQTSPIPLPFRDPDKPTGDIDFGAAVAIDQKTVVVGAPFDAVQLGNKTSAGSASVFFFDGTSWVQQAKLLDGTGLCTELGADVAVSGDTAVIGAPGGSCVLVFQRTGTQWSLASTLKVDTGDVRFGQSVDVAGDSILVGAPGVASGAGCDAGGNVYAYRRNGAQWVLEDTIEEPVETGGEACFGAAVAVDGTIGVAGAPFDDTAKPNAGAGYILERSDAQWSITSRLLAFPTQNENGNFGFAIDIRGDLVVVGAVGVAAYLFQKPTGEPEATGNFRVIPSKWNSERIYIPPSTDLPPHLSKFGFSVSVTSGKAVVGAPDEEPDGIKSGGAVYPSDSTVTVAESCGDGSVSGAEACDDGDTTWKAGQYCNASCEKLACGDVNDSGTITTQDALFVLRAAVSLASCDLQVCDVNKNGSIAAADALQVLKKSVGQSVTLRCP